MTRKLIYKVLVLILALSTALQTASAQNRFTLTGVVFDEAGETMPGVSVHLIGTETGVITDLDGKFSISVPEKGAVIAFVFLGYETQEFPVTSPKSLKIKMRPESQQLEDVVVVAYGTQNKATLTGSLAVANTERLVEAPVATINNVLAGAVTGVSSVQTSGQPGADAAQINIRGVGSLTSSAPLILVDGVERDFSQLDPNEIENLSVLKDASATAVFGVRGANGVIIVTTKRGSTGKPVINFSTTDGVQHLMQYVEQVGSYEYATFWNQKMAADHEQDRGKYFTRESIEAFRTGSDPMMHPSIKWVDVLFRDAFFQSKNNISVSGGTDAVKYFVSFGYMFQDGAMRKFEFQPYENNFNMNRYNYRANLDFKLSPSTNMKVGIGGNIVDTSEPNHKLYNPFTMATIWSVPMAGPGIVDGVRTVIPKGVFPIDNPRDAFDGFFGQGFTRKYDMKMNMDAEITQKLDIITKGLSISLKGAYDSRYRISKVREGGNFEYQTVQYKGYIDNKNKPWTDPDFDKTLVFLPEKEKKPLSYKEKYSQDRSWYLEGRLDYNRRFGNHNVSALFLYNMSRDYYPGGGFTYLPRNYIGYVGRVTYNYKQKYLAEFNAGYNGSENFAPGKTRYGFFPSGSLGWIISEEKFMKKQKFFSFLKLRASWGLVGNDRGVSTRFMYRDAIWEETGGYSFGVDNPILNKSYGYGVPGNKEVTWETAFKQNYGIEMKMLRSRLSFSADVFWEHRTGILIAPQNTPNIIATKLPELNLGVVNNRGYELSLGWDETLKNGFRYNLTYNMSFARNKIMFMDEVKHQYDYQDVTGGSICRYEGYYEYDRLYQKEDFTEGENGELTLKPEFPQPYVPVYPGDCKYNDLNNDGLVNADDKKVAGFSAIPEYIFGITGGIYYKGFNFSMQWTGATNVSKPLGIEYRIPYTNAGGRGLLSYFYEGCWTPERQHDAIYPRAAETSEAWNSENSTLWLMDASYIRLKTLTIGYTMQNMKWMKKIGLGGLGFTFSGYNLLTFSPMKMMDPETIADNRGHYPLAQVFSFGINLKF